MILDHQEEMRPAVAALAELERQAQVTFFDLTSKFQMVVPLNPAGGSTCSPAELSLWCRVWCEAPRDSHRKLLSAAFVFVRVSEEQRDVDHANNGRHGVCVRLFRLA